MINNYRVGIFNNLVRSSQEMPRPNGVRPTVSLRMLTPIGQYAGDQRYLSRPRRQSMETEQRVIKSGLLCDRCQVPRSSV